MRYFMETNTVIKNYNLMFLDICLIYYELVRVSAIVISNIMVSFRVGTNICLTIANLCMMSHVKPSTS